MKYLVWITRSIVAVVFILSGLIKLNDPIGFSFKLEEYFSEGVLHLPFLLPCTLGIALVVVIAEILLGVLLLLGYKPKFTVWSVLIMIIFFTFLTFYSAYFHKVTDCGCFGDAIKLTPWESFTKDIVLLALTLVLVLGRKHLQPLYSTLTCQIVTGVALLGCTGFAYYVLNHLPVVDFRPYAIGTNIQEGMSIPAGASKPVYEYAWQFKVRGRDTVVITYGNYPKIEGEFTGVETTQVQKGYEPPIHNFTIERDGQNVAATFLDKQKLVMIIAYDLAKSCDQAFPHLAAMANRAKEKGYTVVGLTATSETVKNRIKQKYDLNFDFYFTDETTLKTIVRANPAVLVLEKGSIQQKVHYNDLEQLKF